MAGLASLGIGHTGLRGLAAAEAEASQGYVLGPREGEHLIQRGGDLFINVEPARGSESFSMGTQQVLTAVGIPIHRHFHMDEAFHVMDGIGTFLLNDVRHSIEKGASIFIPKNSWHGFENKDHELLLLWVATPPGLEGFFREVASLPGAPAKSLSKEQVNQIARKYGTEFR
jgi:quercetin dioxygenase-like cupin family protein